MKLRCNEVLHILLIGFCSQLANCKLLDPLVTIPAL